MCQVTEARAGQSGGVQYLGQDNALAQEEHYRKARQDSAAESLARLVNDRLGVEVEAGALGAMIRENWPRLAALAHAIHEARQLTAAHAKL
jgi:hypothetical protein